MQFPEAYQTNLVNSVEGGAERVGALQLIFRRAESERVRRVVDRRSCGRPHRLVDR